MFGRKKNKPARFDLEVEALEASEESRVPALAPSAEPPRRALPPASSGSTTIGPGVEFEGTLRFTGVARVDGLFKGKVESGERLEVGPKGEVAAQVSVETLRIEGAVSGNIDASGNVEILAGGRMRGDIRTPAFQVHRGALFTGHCDMGEG